MKYESPKMKIRRFETEELVLASAATPTDNTDATTTWNPEDDKDSSMF